MSVTYRVVGRRSLRKYSSRDRTPVYAAEADAAFIATHLCDVPWTPVAERSATMTWHTDENVGTESDPISGLDMNVRMRDRLDAALFCADHSGGGHRAYANAAAYVYHIPEGARGKVLEGLTVSVTSDPYNAHGARIAVLTNPTGVIPTDCATCRTGGAWDPDSGSYLTPCHADGVAIRDERGGSWYPKTAAVELAPDFELQEYLVVFVLLERYDSVRGNWIEGSSFAENRVALTLSSAVSGWEPGGTYDLSADPESSAEFPVYAPEGSFVSAGSSKAFVFEAVCNGSDEPERAKIEDASEHGDLVQLIRDPGSGALSVASRTRYAGKLPCFSMTGVVCFTTKPELDGDDPHDINSLSFGERMYGRYAVSYVHGTPGVVAPGVTILSKYISGFNTSADPDDEASARFVPADVVAGSGGSSTKAYELLESGDVNDVVMLWGSAFLRTNGTYDIYDESPDEPMVYDLSAYTSITPPYSGWSPVTEEVLNYYVPVAVCASSGMFVLGFLEIPVAFIDGKSSASISALPQCRFLYASGELATTSVVGPYDVLTATGYADTSYCFRSGLAVSADSGEASLDAGAMARLSSSVRFLSRETTESGIVIRSSAGGVNPVRIDGTGLVVAASTVASANKEDVRFFEGTGAADGIAVDVSGDITQVNGSECRSGFASVSVSFSFRYDSSWNIIVTPSGHAVTADSVMAGHVFSGGDVKAVASAGVPSAASASFVVSGGFSSVDGTSYPGACLVTYTFSTGSTSVSGVIIGSPSGFSAAASRGIAKASYAWTGSGGLYLGSAVQADSTSGIELYAATPFDAKISSDVPAERVCGLRNCYGKAWQGQESGLTALTSSTTGAAFLLSRETKTVAVASGDDSGYSLLSIPVWRIAATPFLVPFSFPDLMGVTGLRLSWNQYSGVASAGAVCTVWIRKGERVMSVPEDFPFSDLFSGDVQSAGGWDRIGQFRVTGASGEATVPLSVSTDDRVATVLVTAWFPQDGIAYATFSSPVGLGSVSYGPDGKLIGVTGGFRPSIALVR